MYELCNKVLKTNFACLEKKCIEWTHSFLDSEERFKQSLDTIKTIIDFSTTDENQELFDRKFKVNVILKTKRSEKHSIAIL